MSDVRYAKAKSQVSVGLPTLLERLEALAVFRHLLDEPVIANLIRYLRLCSKPGEARADTVGAYAAFVASLYATGAPDLASLVRDLVCEDDNPYVRLVGAGGEAGPALRATVGNELETLQLVAGLEPGQLAPEGGIAGGPTWLPRFEPGSADIAAAYADCLAHIGQRGYGIYARFHMFYLDDTRVAPAPRAGLERGPAAAQQAEVLLAPVAHPDPVRLSWLVGYERQRRAIVDNTLALLEGRPAVNVLLTGDAGTGKSATVKAIGNEYADRGLRVVEVRKDQLRDIPCILDDLALNPLKFILFIDDLSFAGDDDNYSALKATLEGSIAARSRNVVIYATSNRRHLLKETFSDREGDEVHLNDTLQEALSLSARFGLRVAFDKPDKAGYLAIVRSLAERAGLNAESDELAQAAERFAIGAGGRSARGARQFVDLVLAGTLPVAGAVRPDASHVAGM